MNLTLDFAFQTLLGLAISAFWFYVKNLATRLKEDQAAREALVERLHKVELTYQSRADAQRENAQITELLKEIRADLKEVSEKLDRKADK